MNLTEKYRPKRWSDVVGQSKALATLELLRQRGPLGGRAYFITGGSGTGKGSIAWLLARELAHEACIEQFSGDSLTGAQVRDMARRIAVKGFSPGGRVVIVDEVHGMSAETIRELLVATDSGNIPSHAAWIFTTTAEAKRDLFGNKLDSSPLLSRCLELELSQRGLCEPFAERAREIAQAEGLDGQPIEAYIRLMKDCRNNLRMALSKIEAGCMLVK